jgi:hypothetical protein
MSQGSLDARFYIDPATGLPHTYNHDVREDEVIEVLERPGEDRAGREGARIALGQSAEGRYLRVIYVPDRNPDSVFVITAYDLVGNLSWRIASVGGRNNNESRQISAWMERQESA